jgi:crotonobetainyl-CoA:carnitine CoA-transferase CaiB-like acyl-CoA transferase
MNKAQLAILAALFAASAVLGAVAVTRTTHLGAASRAAQDATVAAQTHQLDAYAASLKKQLHSRPPALPAVPKAAARPASGAPRIVYQQPPPVVVTLHHRGDDGSNEGGGGDD